MSRKEELYDDLEDRLAFGQQTSVVFMDLDGFKQVNDTRGHAAGDRCLETVVEVVNAAIVEKGSLYRYGGDEFVVVLRNFDLNEAAATAERVRQAVETSGAGGDLPVTASIGVVQSGTDLNTREALLAAADAAMYASKNGGKNRVSVHSREHDVPSAAPKSVLERLIDLTMGELERNIQKTGVSAVALEGRHLTALIEYGERLAWNRTQEFLMGRLYALRSMTTVQETMPQRSAATHHANVYVLEARSVVELLRQVKERGLPARV